MGLQDKIAAQRAARAAKAAELEALHREAASKLTGPVVLDAVVTLSNRQQGSRSGYAKRRAQP